MTDLLESIRPQVGFANIPAPLLERVFTQILVERMQGLPVVNPALRVEAVDFIEWEGHWLGVLITPWFISLMIVPKLGSPWPELAMGKGKELKISFPQGSYTFSAREETEIGSYLNCSLSSPVHEWKTHADALRTAHEVMRLIKLIPMQPIEEPVAVGCDQAKNQAPSCNLTRRSFLGGRARV